MVSQKVTHTIVYPAADRLQRLDVPRGCRAVVAIIILLAVAQARRRFPRDGGDDGVDVEVEDLCRHVDGIRVEQARVVERGQDGLAELLSRSKGMLVRALESPDLGWTCA